MTCGICGMKFKTGGDVAMHQFVNCRPEKDDFDKWFAPIEHYINREIWRCK